jgi:hypothetical protein
MKKIITLALLSSVFLASAQAYKGKGDIKAQVGLSLQKYGTGINATGDFGLGENMSYGFTGTYILNSTYGNQNIDLEFKDRFDVKARFNANIGSVIGLPSKMDVYPGLNLGLKNFGGHLGFRYFFTDGFGVFSEASFPISKYDKNASDFNNQFVLNVGASFNL